jgi:hypothetical protein
LNAQSFFDSLARKVRFGDENVKRNLLDKTDHPQQKPLYRPPGLDMMGASIFE